MARRVIIRGGSTTNTLRTDVRQLEDMVRAQYKDIWRQHIEELEEIAEYIEEDAHTLVPIDTGKLNASINVYVTKSRRYPGIIASAYANSGGKPGPNGYKGYDYALIQEENEDYSHEDDRSAHYLGGPFAKHISELFESITDEELELSEELEHAKEYVEDKI